MGDTEFCNLVDSIVKGYKGDGTLLSSAIGVLVVGRYMGWRVLYLLHDEGTLRKYQNVLGVIFKDVLPERGKYAHRSFAFCVVEKVGNFWQVVQRRVKMDKAERVMIE